MKQKNINYTEKNNPLKTLRVLIPASEVLKYQPGPGPSKWRQMTWNLVWNQPVIIHWKYVNCIMHYPVNETAQRNVMNKDITLMAFLNSIWVRFLYTTK